MKTKDRIVRLLRKHPDGLTIKEITKNLKIARNTTTKYLHELKGESRIRIRPLGSAKLHYLSKK